MQLECPVVAVDLGASGSIVEEGVTGEKFRAMDVSDLARKVSALYDNLPKCEVYGHAGRQTALAKYSRESIYETLMGIYAKAMAFPEKE